MCHRSQLLAFLALMMTVRVGVVASAAETDWPEKASWPAWADPGDAATEVQPVTERESRSWQRWLIPLPKRVRWLGKLSAPASAIVLRVRTGAGDVERTAREELARLVSEKTGAVQSGVPFPILIGVCDAQGKIDSVSVPGADRLRGLKNDDQAYVIAPLASRGLAVAGLTERGVYHGVLTLRQLLEPVLEPGKLTAPIVAVMDWPDLAERGEWGPWGNTAVRTIGYMADRKMNLLEVHNPQSLSFDASGRGTVKMDPESRRQARLHAVKWVPVTGHFNSLGKRTGIFKRYPQAEGQGPHAHYPSIHELVAPCASNEEFARVLAEWLESCAGQGVPEMNFYLTELEGMQCECQRCKGTSQYVLEAKACVKAWQIACAKYPDFRIRILLSQGTYHVNDQLLSAVPQPEIGITYYSGSTTYTASREPMIYPLLADFAQKGRWLGCYPQLTASWRVACPWSAPQFMKYRMTEMADKRLTSLSGYAPPDNRLFDFNVTAAAEWSWNAHGRDEREFAAAWATRRRMAEPDKVADWAVMLGPVGWNVYGSGVPHPSFFGPAAAMVARRNRPSLGKGMFRYFPSIQRMDDDLAVSQRALELAGQLKEPALVAETRTIQGYLRMVKSLYLIAGMVATKKPLDDAATKSLQAAFDELQVAMEQTTGALRAWHGSVAPDCSLTSNDPIGVTEQTVADVAKALASLGIVKKAR